MRRSQAEYDQDNLGDLETVIDVLIEVGNGTTDEDLHEACDKLLSFRDWVTERLKQENET